MCQVASRLEEIASVVSSASEQLSAKIEQSRRVSETATAMEEMNGAVLEVARNAGQPSELSVQAKEKAQAASSALGEIVTLVDKSSDQVRAIATASEEQSATSEEINRSVAEVNTISAETAQAMQETSQAQELNTLIKELKNNQRTTRNRKSHKSNGCK